MSPLNRFASLFRRPRTSTVQAFRSRDKKDGLVGGAVVAGCRAREQWREIRPLRSAPECCRQVCRVRGRTVCGTGERKAEATRPRATRRATGPIAQATTSSAHRDSVPFVTEQSSRESSIRRVSLTTAPAIELDL